MQVSSKKLPRGQAELTVELTPDEYVPFVRRAAAAMAARVPIPGFRPGKAPYEMVVKKIGEAKLWEEALEPAVIRTYPQALQQEQLESVGSPHIAIATLAPGNPVVYRATVSLLPAVTFGDVTRLRVDHRPPAVTDADVARTLDDLRAMRRTEVLVSRPARANDKVEIRLETFHENVPVEHGSADRMALGLGEKRFLPGFEAQIVGLTANQTKTFPLPLPSDYHNRAVAGKTVEFRVTCVGVYELTLPELTDDFARSLGKFSSLADCKEKLKLSLLQDATTREDDRLENAILDEVVANSQFSDIPDLLVTTETKNMMAELEEQLKDRGVPFGDYLTHLKKTREQLLLDFTPQAVKRIKGALVTRVIANKQQVNVSEDEIDTAIAREFASSSVHPEVKAKTKTPEFRNRVRNILASRQVMEYLKNTVVSK